MRLRPTSVQKRVHLRQDRIRFIHPAVVIRVRHHDHSNVRIGCRDFHLALEERLELGTKRLQLCAFFRDAFKRIVRGEKRQ